MKFLKFIFFIFLLISLTCFSLVQTEAHEVDSQSQFVDEYHDGIDISHHQGEIDWCSLDSSLDFIICKATEGETFIDSKFEKNWDSIDCIKGCYHFFRPQYSGKKQALLYLSVVNLDSGNIKPIVDVEYTKYWNNKKYIKKYIGNLISFINTIKEKTGQEPIIYTNPNFWETYIQKHYHSDHLLWIADYRKRDTPQVPSKFQDWYIWQYTDKGSVDGINGHVDLNYCKNLDTLLIK